MACCIGLVVEVGYRCCLGWWRFRCGLWDSCVVESIVPVPVLVLAVGWASDCTSLQSQTSRLVVGCTGFGLVRIARGLPCGRLFGVDWSEDRIALRVEELGCRLCQS